MHYNIRSIMLLAFLTHITCNAVQLTLYNSLPCTLHYAIQETANSSHAFSAIEPYSNIETELKETHNIALSIVKEIPQAGQDIPLHTITIASPNTVADLKTYQTAKGEIRLIPQTCTASNNASDKPAVSHHDIWITKTTYNPAPIAQETVQPLHATAPEISETTADHSTQNKEAAQEEQPQVSNTTVDSTAPVITDVSVQGTESHL